MRGEEKENGKASESELSSSSSILPFLFSLAGQSCGTRRIRPPRKKKRKGRTTFLVLFFSSLANGQRCVRPMKEKRKQEMMF